MRQIKYEVDTNCPYKKLPLLNSTPKIGKLKPLNKIKKILIEVNTKAKKTLLAAGILSRIALNKIINIFGAIKNSALSCQTLKRCSDIFYQRESNGLLHQHY